MKVFQLLFVGIALMLAFPKTAQAVPPPDFLFSIGSQLVPLFSIIFLIFSAGVGSILSIAKRFLVKLRYKKLYFVSSLAAVLVLSLASAWLYSRFQQNQLYKEWIQESTQENKDAPSVADNLDKLKVGESQAGQLLVVEEKDKNTAFLQKYYKDLSTGNLAAAYEVSSKKVSFNTYKGWYQDTISVSLDNIQRIDDTNYSLGVTLREKYNTIRYAVLTQLATDEKGAIHIADSKVKVLTAGDNLPSPQKTPPPPESLPDDEEAVANPSFFRANQNLPLAVSNEEFKSLLNSHSNGFYLDAREDEEYAIGHFPPSTHIRFADLKAGEWIGLPNNKIVYVFCWSGIRGQEVAEFLRSKNIVARYIENGADDWVKFGGRWEGGIKFLDVYTAERYQIVFTTDEVKEYQRKGVVVIDSRPETKFSQWHIPGSVNIPVIYTPTGKLEEVLGQVPRGSTVITVCDDFVSCFDAKVGGVKLEKRGNTFLGRYNKPWEYRRSN